MHDELLQEEESYNNSVKLLLALGFTFKLKTCPINVSLTRSSSMFFFDMRISIAQ